MNSKSAFMKAKEKREDDALVAELAELIALNIFADENRDDISISDFVKEYVDSYIVSDNQSAIKSSYVPKMG